MTKVAGKKRRLTWWLMLLLIVTVLSGSYLVFRQVEMRLQKAEFKRAETYVAQVAAGIKNSAHSSPNFASHTYSCHYASRKFTKGPRSCEVSYQMIFKNQSLDSSNDLLNMFSSYTKSRIAGPNGETIFINKPTAQTLEQDLAPKGLNGMSCSILYRYGLVDDSLGAPTQYRAKDFVVSINCYGGALAEYYPVSQ